MRAIRIILQVIVVAFFALLMFVLFRQEFDPTTFIGVSIFFCFVFALTLLLREHTESRLVITRRINPKIIGSFLAFTGCTLCWVAWLIANDHQFSSSWRGRRLTSIIEFTGPWPPSVFFLALGITVIWVGFRVCRSNEL